jgi:hypothetical protein
MARAAVRESVTLAGRAHAARAFVSEVLGFGHPCRDDAVLLVSEIFSNSRPCLTYLADGHAVGLAALA